MVYPSGPPRDDEHVPSIYRHPSVPEALGRLGRAPCYSILYLKSAWISRAAKDVS